MTDKQKLVYDLSLICASVQYKQHMKETPYLQAAVLDAFSESVRLYSAMLPDALDAALDELKAISP